MTKEDKIHISANLFYPNKLFLLFLVVLFLSVSLGFSLPFFLGKTDVVFTLAAFLIFLPPIFFIIISKRKSVILSELHFDNTHFEIIKNGLTDLTIEWDNIERYDVVYPESPAFTPRHYIVDIKKRNGGRKSICVVDDCLINSDGEIKQNSALDIFCEYISSYNQQQSTDSSKIQLEKKLYSKKTIKYLYILPLGLLIFDIFYRFSHPNIGLKFHLPIFLFALLYTLSILLRGKRNANFYNAVLRLHNGDFDKE